MCRWTSSSIAAACFVSTASRIHDSMFPRFSRYAFSTLRPYATNLERLSLRRVKPERLHVWPDRFVAESDYFLCERESFGGS